MIRILKMVATLVLCAVCFSLPIWSQSDAVSNGGRISLKQSTVDVGNIKGDSIVEGKFTVYNIGDQPVEILKIFSDCSCAVASFSSDPVEPGDSMTFVAKYDPRGYKYSRFRHRFRIRSTASNSYISAVLTGSIKHDK